MLDYSWDIVFNTGLTPHTCKEIAQNTSKVFYELHESIEEHQKQFQQWGHVWYEVEYFQYNFETSIEC